MSAAVSRLLRLPWILGGGLCLLALLSRAPAFVMSVVDWDESLYFIMAEQWRAGHLPYTAVWDNKPLGIYAIFAAFQSIFGDHILAMRLAALLAVTATGLIIWRIGRHVLRDRPPLIAELCGAAAGALFILTSIPDDGIAANTEIFMEAFTCLGLLWALTPMGRIGPPRAIAIGFALGAAFMIKYVAVFDMFAVFAVMLLLPGRIGRGLGALRDVIRQGLFFSLGALTPFLAVAALYAAYGAFPAFVEASLLSNLRRVAVPVSGGGALGAYAHQAALFPLLYAGLLWLVLEAVRGRSCRRLLLVWAFTSALGVASGGLYFSHYFLQILPVLCVAAGLLLAAALSLPYAVARAGLIALALFSLWPMAARITPDLGRMIAVAARPPVPGLGLLRDTPAKVAADLLPELKAAPGETIYVFDGEPVLYSLTQARLPTRYVFPSFLQSRLLAHMIGIDPVAVLDGIMAARPLFVIRRTNPDDRNAATRNLDVYARMNADLAARYTVWRRYDSMVVWRRNP